MDCEQRLQQIDTNVKQLLDGGSNKEIVEALESFGDALIDMTKQDTENTDKIVEALNHLNKNFYNAHKTNVDTNKVSKAILNYLNKVQSFLKI